MEAKKIIYNAKWKEENGNNQVRKNKRIVNKNTRDREGERVA